MKPFKIYQSEKSNLPTRIIGGDASGVRDWDNLKYPTMVDIRSNLWEENWNEHEIKLGKDMEQYKSLLSEREKYVFNTLTGMLNELDSSATDFLTYLFMITTDPSVRSIIALILGFETLHNASYQYLTSSMLNGQQKHQAFEEVKNIKALQDRNAFLYEKINTAINAIRKYIVNDEEQTEEFTQAIFEGVLAYQCLEGLYFSGGFVYFHALARSQKMIGSNNMIMLIKADEQQHSEFFGMFVRMLMAENPHLNTQANMDYAVNFIKEAVEREKKWANFIFEGLDLFSIKEYEDYVEYLANLIARNAGMQEPFADNKEIKSRWIVTYGSKKRNGKDNKQIVTRSSFLEGNTINYTHEDGEDFDL
ncbi:ribonucleotide-diphosphate reductase subunit beta [Bacillus sp. 7586-K]|nr:ribonucleotide-diphosphate reductase subunit beta [Bacillus sp. 7586-K]